MGKEEGEDQEQCGWDNIKDWLNLSYKECIKNVENREKWRSITFNLLTADKT